MNYTALDSDDDDADGDGADACTVMRMRAGRTYRSPVRAPSTIKQIKPRVPPDLDRIAETEFEEDGNDFVGGGGQQEDSDEEIARAGSAKKEPKFDWDDNGHRLERELKLATAVHNALAYECPKGTKEVRWKKVVIALKGSKDQPSVLFRRLGDDTTKSWRTLAKHWEDVYTAWEKGEKIEHKTSGAAATYGDTERIYTTIQADKRNGMGQKKPAKNSYTRESLESLKSVLDGSIGGSALKRAAQQVYDEVEEVGNGTDDDDDNKITPKKKVQKVAKERQGRGQGKNNKSDAQAQQSNLSDVGMLKVKLDGEAQVRQHQLDERRMLLEERKMELEERREERMADDRKMEREQMLAMLQVTKAMVEKLSK